ncbi:hypothetical protein HY732_00715 [Candidatus Uhrbacteria bacterium]|nr:hypothetical protein [Candidatus Uhrbacteria bacterium]
MHLVSRSARLSDIRTGRKKISRSFFIASGVAGLGLLGFATYALFFSPLVSIQFIDVAAPDGIDQTAVRSVVFEQMNRNRFGIFSQRNVFMISKKELEANLKKQFVIDSFLLMRKPPHTLSLTLSGKPFRLLWVAGRSVHDIASDGTVFRAIDPSSPIAASALVQSVAGMKDESGRRTDIPVIVDEGGQPPVVGDSVISSESLLFVVDAWRVFDQGGIDPSYALLTDNNPTITFVTTEGWRALVSSLGDIGEQFEHVRQVRDRYSEKKRSTIQYIDARFDNRVYVK